MNGVTQAVAINTNHSERCNIHATYNFSTLGLGEL